MRKNKKGFTLVELVIVIAVIAILASVLIPTFAGIIERAKESSAHQQAVSARDEFLSGNDKNYLMEDMIGFVIEVDNLYFEIKENGKLQKVEFDSSDYSVLQQNAVSNSNVSIYVPGVALEIDTTPGIVVNDTFMNWNDIADTYFDIQGYTLKAIRPEYLTSITQISIPDSIKELGCYGDGAFEGATNLQTIIFSPNITYRENGTFYGCTNLKSVYFTGTIYDWCDINWEPHVGSHPMSYAKNLVIEGVNYGRITELSLPSDMTTIGDFAFAYLTNLKKVTIHKNITKIGYAAFGDCVNLEQVVIESNSTLEIIDQYAFRIDNSKITTMYIPSSIKKIGNYAFYDAEITFTTDANWNWSEGWYKCDYEDNPLEENLETADNFSDFINNNKGNNIKRN